jgi:hypothetical protein
VGCRHRRRVGGSCDLHYHDGRPGLHLAHPRADSGVEQRRGSRIRAAGRRVQCHGDRTVRPLHRQRLSGPERPDARGGCAPGRRPRCLASRLRGGEQHQFAAAGRSGRALQRRNADRPVHDPGAIRFGAPRGERRRSARLLERPGAGQSDHARARDPGHGGPERRHPRSGGGEEHLPWPWRGTHAGRALTSGVRRPFHSSPRRSRSTRFPAQTRRYVPSRS